jgi:hypothetical protein
MITIRNPAHAMAGDLGRKRNGEVRRAMKPTQGWRPEVEALEDRTAPGSVRGLLVPPLADAGHHAARHHAAVHKALRPRGQVSGTWTTVFTNPDAGHEQRLDGTGTVTPLGAVSVSGTLTAPGFIARGRATGTLTLTVADGTVTLGLVGPPQKGFSAPPTSFRYTITAGTGADAGASGKGRVGFQEQQSPTFHCPPNALCLPLLPGGSLGGTFTMTFQPGR